MEESRLHSVRWEPALDRAVLAFECLRRRPDGNAVEDSIVAIEVSDLAALAIAHRPALNGIPPSKYRPERQLVADDLRSWPLAPEEAEVAFNSPDAEEEVLLSHRLDWVLGDGQSSRACSNRLVVFLDHSACLGTPANNIMLLFAGGGLAASSAGANLDPDTWQREFRAWWDGWDKHWSRKGGASKTSPEEGAKIEDTVIPLREDPPPDTEYEPPAEPPFELEPNELPEELVKPIRDWFCSLHTRNWEQRARATRDLDRSVEDQAQHLEKSFLTWNFGNWGYGRQIESWWREGSLAEVEVRGLEHHLSADWRSPENRECVWTFRLHERDSGWVVRSWGKAWPSNGTAPKKSTAEAPWKARWTSGGTLT